MRNDAEVKVLMDMLERDVEALSRAVARKDGLEVLRWARFLSDDVDRLEDAIQGKPLRPVRV